MSSKLPLSPKGDIAQLTRLGRVLVPYRWRVVGALVALVVAASCVLALGQGLRHVIDAGFGTRDSHLLNLKSYQGIPIVAAAEALDRVARR